MFLFRLSISLERLGTFFKLILRHYSWKHAAMIVHETPSKTSMINLIRRSVEDAIESDLELSLEVTEIPRSLAKVNLTEKLIECAKETRSMPIANFHRFDN